MGISLQSTSIPQFGQILVSLSILFPQLWQCIASFSCLGRTFGGEFISILSSKENKLENSPLYQDSLSLSTLYIVLERGVASTRIRDLPFSKS